MNSHDLANLLLTLPNKEVATHANNHTYTNRDTHGPLRVALINEQIVIGNLRNCKVLWDEAIALQEKAQATLRTMGYGDMINEIAKRNPDGIDVSKLYEKNR